MKAFNRLISLSLTFVILSGLLFSCISEDEKKDRLIRAVSNNMCNNLGADISNGYENQRLGYEPINALSIAMIKSFDVPIKDFCICFSELISKKILSKFSYSELMEIRNDKIKQMMIVAKFLELNYIQTDILACISQSSKQYLEFQKSLDEKYGK